MAAAFSSYDVIHRSLWLPRVEGTNPFSVHVPEMVVRHEIERARKKWKECHHAWCESNRCNYSIWRGRFEAMVRGDRCGAMWSDQSPRGYGWTESYIATELERIGFTAWTRVNLFRSRDEGEAENIARTRVVETRLVASGLPLPRHFISHLDFRPKNPDIVGYRQLTDDWLFVEVKRDETVQEAQLQALAFLHLLFGARVGVVRVVPIERSCTPRPHVAAFTYSGSLAILRGLAIHQFV